LAVISSPLCDYTPRLHMLCRSFRCLNKIEIPPCYVFSVAIALLVFFPAKSLGEQQDFPIGGQVSCIYSSKGVLDCNGTKFTESSTYKVFSSQFWLHIVVLSAVVVGIVFVSGIIPGISSIDMTNLNALQKSSSPDDQRTAKRVIPLVQRRHLMLVTFYLLKLAGIVIFPIYLSQISNPWVGVVISIFIVLFFSEIIPPGIFKKHGLSIMASAYWLMWFFVAVTFVISWPLSKLLEVMLGKQKVFNRAEFKEMIEMQLPELWAKDGNVSTNENEALTKEEVTIISGALEMRNKYVMQRVTPLDEVFMLPISTVLDKETINQIKEAGHSRIPIYREHRDHIVAMLHVKSLISIDTAEKMKIGDLELNRCPQISSNMPLYKMLNMFQTGKSHMAVVLGTDSTRPIGIITLEDVIEELIQDEIEDETDARKRLKGSHNLTKKSEISEPEDTSSHEEKDSEVIPLNNDND